MLILALVAPATPGHNNAEPAAYVATVGGTVIPVTTATNKAGPPITVPAGPAGVRGHQLSVDYNAHVIESILTHVAPALGWR